MYCCNPLFWRDFTGAGGLVRAYSKSAALAVEKAGKTPLIIITEFELVYNYEMSKTIQKYLEQYSVDYSPPVFLEKISLTGRLPSEVFDSFSKELKNIYYKDLEINIIKNEYSRSIWER